MEESMEAPIGLNFPKAPAISNSPGALGGCEPSVDLGMTKQVTAINTPVIDRCVDQPGINKVDQQGVNRQVDEADNNVQSDSVRQLVVNELSSTDKEDVDSSPTESRVFPPPPPPAPPAALVDDQSEDDQSD